MKPPRRVAFKAPRVPQDVHVKKALEQTGLSSFAYHPPANLSATPKRMDRPRGGKGPHN